MRAGSSGSRYCGAGKNSGVDINVIVTINDVMGKRASSGRSSDGVSGGAPDAEFDRLLAACAEVAGLFQEGVAFIGGIAVYLHAINLPGTRDFAEATHDADIYISLADMADLRDLEEVTANRRLSKHQMVKHGFEFDIYTERQSSLIVPYDAVMAHAVSYDGTRVASLEHLLVLKLEAFADRKGSVKGDKDAKDLLRIGAVAARGASGFRAALSAPYIRDVHIDLLTLVERGPQVTSLAMGNAMVAKRLRREFGVLVAAVKKDYAGPRVVGT